MSRLDFWNDKGISRLYTEIDMYIRRYNKDFIAELLAETIRGTGEAARQWVNVSDMDTRSGLEDLRAHSFGESPSGEAVVERPYDQNQEVPSIISTAIVCLTLLLFSAALLVQQSPPTAGSRLQNAYPAILLKVATPRPASARISAVDAVALTVAEYGLDLHTS